MKTQVVKKNHPTLLLKRGRGFFGRVLPVMFGTNFVVLQNIKGRPRTEAVIRYADFEFADTEIFKLQQLFLKRYKVELEKLESNTEFCGSQPDGKKFVRILQPVNKQSKIIFE